MRPWVSKGTMCGVRMPVILADMDEIAGLGMDTQRPQFRVPGFAIRAGEHLIDLMIADGFFLFAIPNNLAARLERKVRQVTGRHHAMATFHIGHRLFARLDAVEEITLMP